MFRTSLATTPTPAKFAPLLFAGQWQAALDTACQLGFDAVETSLCDPNDPVVHHMFEGIRTRNLALSAIATGQSYYNDGLSLTSLKPWIRAELFRRLSCFVELAAPWQATLILGGIRGKLEGEAQTYPAQREAARQMIADLAAFSEPFGVRLALEPVNRYETNFLNTVRECLDFAGEVGAANLGVLPDTFHMNIEETSLVGALREAGERCIYLHFPDSNRLAPGQGHVDFINVIDFIKEIGYNGYVCAEILPYPDSHTAAEQAVHFFHGLQEYWTRGGSTN
jgi:5-keto-L-gluconate epimerase